MLISRLAIENYKSLKSLTLEPAELTILIGANASGKSNLAECIDFISEVYRHGLEMAIARKGGYENIAHRKASRSKASVKIEISVDFKASRRWLPPRIAEVLNSQPVRVCARSRLQQRGLRSVRNSKSRKKCLFWT